MYSITVMNSRISATSTSRKSVGRLAFEAAMSPPVESTAKNAMNGITAIGFSRARNTNGITVSP